MVTLGIDRIGEYASLLKGKKLGLITNYSGVDSRLEEDLDVFAEAGYYVDRLFTPEHGLYGAMDGAAVDNNVHPKYHIPMISLYGQKKKPSAEDLKGLDLLIYDIQDVGLRYYTYIYTLANCMEAAAENHVGLVVLDRPNPLGSIVGGNRMAADLHTFVGDHELATRYGLTPGELGYYFKHHLGLETQYDVIPMKGYQKEMRWPQTGQLWNLPSPSIHTFQSALCYYGGCFFEGTNISEGRGTAEPFQIYGAPFIDMDKLVEELKQRIQDPNLTFRKRAFTPFWSKHAGETCFGVEFIPLNENLDFMPAALVTMKTIKELYPEQFEFRSYADVGRLAQLSGDGSANEYLNDKLSLAELLTDWEEQAADFENEVREMRIYD
ncbi:MAG: DUF1343 domain-containing protein [Lachnospiraceae bacterium]|jgi:uncharacterized protein YbbC (DUF1343 family)|nr:DUF1343 domain-containing protein [Lachnospiraceae bacterium]